MDASSPSLMLSPSRARKDAAQARDWAYIAPWLTRKYHPHSVPRFERNEATLQTLLTLAAFTDAADEQAHLLHKAMQEETMRLRAREAADGAVHAQLISDMESCLTVEGDTALQDLADLHLLLGSLSPSTQHLGEAVIELTGAEYEAKAHLRNTNEIQSYLDNELVEVYRQIEALNTNSAYHIPEQLPSQSTEWTQGTKMLGVKLGEYRERITALDKYNIACPSIQDLRGEEQEVIRLMQKVKGLERRVHSFHGLPPDTVAAKVEQEAAEAELNRLTLQRDAVFEGLMDNKSLSRKRR